jgi:hypothetical protein
MERRRKMWWIKLLFNAMPYIIIFGGVAYCLLLALVALSI